MKILIATILWLKSLHSSNLSEIVEIGIIIPIIIENRISKRTNIKLKSETFIHLRKKKDTK